MSLGPYTYVTVALSTDSPGYLGVSFHTSDLWVRSGVLDSGRPYLELSSREAAITVSTSGGGPVTEADVAVARALRQAVTRYLADCERLHSMHQAGDQPAA